MTELFSDILPTIPCTKCDGIGARGFQPCPYCKGHGSKRVPRPGNGPKIIDESPPCQPLAPNNPRWHRGAQPRHQLVLARGKSYNTQHPLFLTAAYYDPEWRPLDPWRFPTGDALSDFGWTPQEWRHLTPDELSEVRHD